MDPYAVLGVAKGATTEDIRRAYRALALKYHPDKNLGANAEANRIAFERVQKAHDILADASKRRLYDEYGSEGLRVLKAVGNVQLAEFVLDSTRARLIFVVLWLAVLLLLITPFGVMWKLEHPDRLYWSVILLPLPVVIVMAVLLGNSLLKISETLVGEGDAPDKDAAASVKAARILLYIVSGVLMLQLSLLMPRLDEIITWNWWFILLPLVIFEGLILALTFLSALNAVYNSDKPVPPPAESTFFRALRFPLSRFVFLILVIVRAQHFESLPAWALFMPMYLYIASKNAFEAWYEANLPNTRVWVVVVLRLILASLAALPFALVNIKLDLAVMSWYVALLPITIPTGLLFVAAVVIGIYILWKMPGKGSAASHAMDWMTAPGYALCALRQRRIRAPERV